jgi:hypothetical protein
VSIETTDIKKFVDQLGTAARGDFRKELAVFIEGVGMEFLKVVQDEIIRKQTVDTRLLLNSFQKSEDGNLFTLNEGNLTVEVGTNVEYASYVNAGHWLNPKGVQTRFVPGHWSGDRFIYEPGAKTGMLLKQKWVEGSHYWDDAIRIMEEMLPGLMEAKIQQWIQNYFSV